MSTFGLSAMLGGRRTFDADLGVHLAKLSSSDTALELGLSTLFATLKLKNIWTSLDDLCVTHKVSADSILGLKGKQNSTLVGSPSFSATAGFTCVNTSAYIKTGIWTTGTFQVATNDMSGFFFLKSKSVASALDLYGGMGGGSGGSSEFALGMNNAGTQAQSRQAGVALSLTTSETRFFGMSKTASNLAEIRVNALSSTSSTVSSDSGPDREIYVGVQNVNGAPLAVVGNRVMAAWGVGAGLTSQQLSDLRDAIETYMVSRGI